MAQLEIKKPIPLLDSAGHPINCGWARLPLFQYDPGGIRVSRRRVAESDRYILLSPTHIAVLEIFDSGYLGALDFSVVSLKDKQRFTQAVIVPFPLGVFEMPANSETGSLKTQHKRAILDFVTLGKGVRLIKADAPQLGHRRRLRGKVVLFESPGTQSLLTHMLWREEKNAFRCSRRSWYRAEGVIQCGITEIVFTQGNAWGIFDWNRGVRPSSDMRYWAAGCGLYKGKQIGLTVGYDSADSSTGTENGFFLEGKLHKLDQVTFHISPTNWLHPWHFTSNDSRLDMVFTPFQERVEHNRLFFHTLKYRQVYGFFSGRVILDNGSELQFQNLTGFAERRKTRF